MTHDESSSPLVPTDDTAEPSTSNNEPLSSVVFERDEQARKPTAEFLKMVIRLRGVQISRDDYPRQKLCRRGIDDDTITSALKITPVQAGPTLARLDGPAAITTTLGTRKSAAISFAAGLPGGFVMFVAIPADVIQHYVHAFRVMQRFAYVYGWKDSLGGPNEIDDETPGKMNPFLGVMLGVSGATSPLTAFAKQIARSTFQKQIAKRTLTKTAQYGPMKRALKPIGIKVSKDSFAKGVTRMVPVIGGATPGGMMLMALKSQSTRLYKHLRETPLPGVDAAEYLAALDDLGAQADEPHVLAAIREKVKGAAGEVSVWIRGASGSLLHRV